MNFDLLLPEQAGPTLKVRFGTVTAGGSVHIDGETEALAAAPKSLIELTPGERVAILQGGKTLLVVGQLGGIAPPPPVADTGWITFSTTPTGSGKYRKVGNRVDVQFGTTANVTGTNTEVTVYTLPEGFRPLTDTHIAAGSASTKTRPANAFVGTDGAIKVRNNYSSDAPVHGSGSFYID